jgi:hypothetical protein
MASRLQTHIRIFSAWVRWRTELPYQAGNNLAVPAGYFFLLPEVDWRVRALGSCS